MYFALVPHRRPRRLVVGGVHYRTRESSIGISRGQWREGRLYRLEGTSGEITTALQKCASNECDCVRLVFIDGAGDVLELGLTPGEFDQFAQAVMDYDVSRWLRQRPRNGRPANRDQGDEA